VTSFGCGSQSRSSGGSKKYIFYSNIVVLFTKIIYFDKYIYCIDTIRMKEEDPSKMIDRGKKQIHGYERIETSDRRLGCNPTPHLTCNVALMHHIRSVNLIDFGFLP